MTGDHDFDERQPCTGDPPHVLEDNDPPGGRMLIVDEECGRCGFDRLRATQTAGPTTKKCLFCGASQCNGDDWERSTTDSDRLRDMREYADMDGPVQKLGEYGPSSRFTYGHEVFRSEDTGTFTVFEHARRGTSVSQTRLSEQQVTGILSVLDGPEAVDILRNALGNDVERGIAAVRLMPDDMLDGLRDTLE